MNEASLPLFARLRSVAIPLVLCCVFLPMGCGGGGGSQQAPPPPPPPTPDFTLSANPASVSIPAGGSATTSLSAAAVNGFSSQITVQISGLPSGVSVLPSNITVTPGTPLQVTLSASSAAAAATATATFTGTSGQLTHTANLSVAVTRGSSQVLPTRTQYVRTDATTEYFTWLNQHWVVFDPPTLRFFVTDPQSNQIIVLDSTTETQIGSIKVPGAFGIDETPDHTTLYVGTLIGDVYTIDPVAMQVKHRYLGSGIGPYGYRAFSALVLANGNIALLGAQGGIPSVDGSTSFAVWNPITNSITIYASGYGSGQLNGLPFSVVCGGFMGNIGGFTLSTDRTKVIVGSIDSDDTLCEVDASSGQDNYVAANAYPIKIVTSPDGRYIALPQSGQVVLYDARTLQNLTSFPVAGDTSSGADLMFSVDSQTLYVPSPSIVYAYSVATHQQTGWTPNIVLPPTSGGGAVGPINGPDLQSVDGTGLLGGPLEEGFGFIDSSSLHTGPVGTAFANAYLNPATGPTSGGTSVQWSAPATLNAQSTIFFGKNVATGISLSGSLLTVTTPAGPPGPVNVFAFANDGGMQIVPDGFSYGPTILEVTPDASTAEGGGTGIIYGYGFGPASATTIPTDLRVTVGGAPASITGFNSNAYGLFSPPFLLQSVYYTIPAGAAGSAADVSVTTSSGTATARSSLSYLPALKQYPLSAASLAQGVYDPARDVYYFTDANKIQVFSLRQGVWLTPILIPAPSGATQRLWGISLSSDDSKLAVADIQAAAIYVIDLSNPSSVKTFPFAPSEPAGVVANPAGVAITDSGIVYIVAYIQGGTGFSNYFKLDTTTGTLTDFHITGPQLSIDGVPQDPYLRTAISSDDTRVFFNNDGDVFSIDTATDKVSHAAVGTGCCYGNYDLTLSANQTQLEATSYLFDSDLDTDAAFSANDREALSISYVYGTKLSPDGSLLFQPSTNGLDIIDGKLGMLRSRIALPVALSQNYDALVSDGRDNVLLVITGTSGNGIAVLDLSSISEPPPLPYSASLSYLHGKGAARNNLWENRSTVSRRSDVNSMNATAQRHVIPHATNFNLLHIKK